MGILPRDNPPRRLCARGGVTNDESLVCEEEKGTSVVLIGNY